MHMPKQSGGNCAEAGRCARRQPVLVPWRGFLGTLSLPRGILSTRADQPCPTLATGPAESLGTARPRTRNMLPGFLTPREGHTAPLSSAATCSPHLYPRGRKRNLPKEQEQHTTDNFPHVFAKKKKNKRKKAGRCEVFCGMKSLAASGLPTLRTAQYQKCCKRKGHKLYFQY